MAAENHGRNEVTMTEDRDGLIAVIGMAGRFPGADTLERFWENLVSGADVRTTFTDEELAGIIPGRLLKNEQYVKKGYVLGNVDGFDAEFFGYTPREAEELDPQQRLFLECAWEAFEDAGHVPGVESSVGVYASITQSSYLVSDNLTMPEHPMPFFSRLMGNDKDYAAARVAYKLGLKGPAFSVQSACSSSLVAAATACQALLDYHCDMALAGGVSVSLPEKTGYLAGQDGAMSRDACCHAFDHRASGMMYGNGVGVVLLRRLEDALEAGDHIYGVVRGFAVNNDGSDRVGFSAPGVHGQQSVLQEALDISGVDAGSVTFIETHGTGTPLGDPMEIRALEKVYGASSVPCALGSVKTNVGHLNSAAGIAGFMHAMLCLDRRMLTPTLHFERANPEIDFENSRFHVQLEACPWKAEGPLRAAVSSFGLGGTNCHMVLEEAPCREASRSSGRWCVIPLSAATEESLNGATARLADFLERHADIPLQDAAYTLQRGRRHFAHRRALAADSVSSLLTHLKEGRWNENSRPSEAGAPAVYFLFPGAGSQYVGMGRELYADEPVYREAVDECARILLPLLGEDVRDVLYAEGAATEEAARKMATPTFSFASLFATEYALARLWMHRGIRPAGCVGHSFGQYLAAVMAGVFSLEDALAVAVRRGQLMDRVEEGAMLLLYAPEEAVLPLLEGSLSVAAVNAEKLCTVSGRPEDMNALEEKLGSLRIHYRRVAATRAGHSVLMEPILQDFRKMLSSVHMQKPVLPLLSNVSGTWMTDEEAVSPDCWTAHIRRPVRYSENIAAVLKDGNAVLLEVGPGKVLGTLARRHADLKGQPIVFSMRDEGQGIGDGQAFASACAALYVAGAELVWPEEGLRISMPTYAFAHRSYWSPQAGPRSAVQTEGTALASMMGRFMEKKSSIDDWFVLPQWRRTFLPRFPEKASAGRFLLLADDSGVADSLAGRIALHGGEAALVRMARGKLHDGELSARPGVEEDMRAVLETLRDTGFEPDFVIHAWLAGGEDGTEEEMYARGYQSLVGLVRALSSLNMDGRHVGIAVLADGVQTVTGRERTMPEKAAVLGPCRVIPQEYRNMQTCSIDIELPAGGEALPDDILDAVLSDVLVLRDILEEKSPAAAHAETIAYRGRSRLEETFAHIPLAPGRENGSSVLRRGGVYMITGGFGGVACELSRYLVRGWEARLVLVGRTPLPPRDRWDAYLSSCADDAVAFRIRHVRELEAMGGECLVMAADTADIVQMTRVCDAALERFSVINGVFHAASTVSSGMIQAQTDERARAVIDTKARGARVIGKLMERTAPDFVMLFSSLCSCTAPLGFTDYAAGCCVMDAFARAAAHRLPYRVVSVNWGYWDGIGIGMELLPKMMETVGASVETGGILAHEGMECIRRILELSEAQVMVSPSDYPALAAELRNSAKKVLREYASGRASSACSKRPRLSVPYVEPESAVEKVIAAVWQEILGFDAVGLDDAFAELGGDSLHAIPMVSRLEGIFHTRVPIRALITENTVRKLAAYLMAGERKAGQTARIAELFIKIRNMSADEVKAMLARKGQL